MTYDDLLKMLKAAGSGFVGGVAGLPADTAVAATNLSRAAYGYGGHKLGLLSAGEMPQPIEPKNVPGTSAHLSGLLGVGETPQEQVAEFVGGLLSPGPKTAKAPNRSNWTAYHGSPHKFDKFSLDKIGTGEGAQAYGHGLYFADNPQVAQEYARTLANRDPSGYATAHMNAQNLVKKLGGDARFAAEVVEDQLRNIDKADPNFERLTDTLGAIKSGNYAKPLSDAGRLYKVDIDDTRAPKDAFLHYDKPLPVPVAKKLHNMAGEFDAFEFPALSAAVTGKHPRLPAGQPWVPHAEDVIDDFAMAKGLHRNSPEMTGLLKQLGFPGIRYLDAGSRSGGGTYNTVLFDDSLVKILERQ